MSLKHAILVLLEAKPASGSDLVERFDSGIGNFWSATHQQVYQELKHLHGEKLVAFDVKTQSDRPDKKIYRLTRAGRQALKHWLAQPVKPQRLKQALLVKVFGAHLADRAALVAELDHQAQHHEQALAEYRRMETDYFTQNRAMRGRHRLPYLTLRAGILYELAWLEWLRETRILLAEDRLPDQPVAGGDKLQRLGRQSW